MKIEDQVSALAEIGLRLNDGVTVADLLYSFDREAYESKPFDLILFMLGAEVEREPWGRLVCDRAWNFDTECIASTGDYVEILRNLCRVANMPDLLGEVSDHVDLSTGEAWLEYQYDGKERHWPVKVNNDWADTLTLSLVMDDIERDGCRFYYKDNGQAMVIYYLDEATVKQLNALSPEELTPIVVAAC